MNWKIATSIAGAKAARAPLTLDLPKADGANRLDLVGPAAKGWIYRSRQGGALYRVLALADATLPFRHAINTARERTPPPLCAAIARAWRPEEFPYFCIEYAAAGRTFSEALLDPNIPGRLEAAARVLRALPTWLSQRDGRPLIPLPTEIVLFQNGLVHLLDLPAAQAVGAEDLFQQLARWPYLAPELVRGQRDVSIEAVSRYAVGAALLQCFFACAAIDDGERAMEIAARGAIADHVTSSLPPWMGRHAATAGAVEIARQLTATAPATRCAAPLEELAGRLETASRRLDPMLAVRELRAEGKPVEALTLALDVLLTQESYELLLLAGTIAHEQASGRVLEALDLFERAIRRESDRPEAYAAQFALIVSMPGEYESRETIESDIVLAGAVDARVWRDFQKFSAEEQAEQATALGLYLVWRKQFAWARQFLYPRLFASTGTYQWWKIELNVLYATSLIGEGQLGEASQLLANLRGGLAHGFANGNFDEIEVEQYNRLILAAEQEIADRAQQPPAAATTASAGNAYPHANGAGQAQTSSARNPGSHGGAA